MHSTRIFRALLRCLPAPFRHEYGGELERAFADELSDAGRTGRSRAAVWLRAAADLFKTAPQEHYHVIKHDVRYALRTLAAAPGFTAVAVLSLALGIGANVALFSLVNAVLLRTLPVHRPQELVMLTHPSDGGESTGSQSGERGLLTYQEFLWLRDHTSVFASLMAVQSGPSALYVRVNGGDSEKINGRMVSAEYFGTLGVPALAGRTPGVQDGARAPLAVISHEFWQRRFGGRPEAIGARIEMRLGSFTVVGVMPASFFGELVGDRPDVWLPLDLQPVVFPGRDWLNNRTDLQKTMWLHAFGRLKPGVTREQAQAAANVAFQQELAAFYTGAPTEEMRRNFLNQRLRLRPAATGSSGLRDDFGEPLTVMLIVTGLVLLIACANLGNLMLARATARTREVAVRLALGAGRGSLIRQMLTESMLIALAGGIAGVGAAWLIRAGLMTLVPDDIRLPAELDPDVVAFAFAVTLAVGLVLGLLPALRMMHVDANAGLREQGRGITGSAAWLRTSKFVVAAQVALSLPLLVGAGLLVRTLDNLQQVNLGFARDNLFMVRADVVSAGYEEPRRQDLFDRLLARVRAVPGVKAAGYSQYGMLVGGDSGDEVVVEGYVRTGRSDRGSAYDHVGPGLFASMGIPLLLGREITERDTAASPRVCVINEAFAKKFFAGRNPIGQHVTQLYGRQRNTYQVVGVVANSRKRSLRGEVEHRYYVPTSQPIDVPHDVTFSVRTVRDAATMMNAVREAIRAEDPHIPVTVAKSVGELIDARTIQDRLLARLSLAFGLVALLLTAIGLYGVLSYGVSRRTSEIGIRKALGARESTVISMILRETGWILSGGLVIGAGLAFGSLRWIQSRLFGLAPHDPATLAGAAAVLGVVALVAAWLPARRASRVDPLVAIRCD